MAAKQQKDNDNALQQKEGLQAPKEEVTDIKEAEEQKPPVYKLLGHLIQQADVARNLWRVVPKNGTPLEALLEPVYWTHVAQHLRRGDKIEAFAEDGSYYAEYLVVNSAKQWAKVAPLKVVNFVQRNRVQKPDYQVVFKGNQALWCVIRTKDNEILQDKITSEELAQDWLEDHMKAIG